jgi:hypothetical protein
MLTKMWRALMPETAIARFKREVTPITQEVGDILDRTGISNRRMRGGLVVELKKPEFAEVGNLLLDVAIRCLAFVGRYPADASLRLVGGRFAVMAGYCFEIAENFGKQAQALNVAELLLKEKFINSWYQAKYLLTDDQFDLGRAEIFPCSVMGEELCGVGRSFDDITCKITGDMRETERQTWFNSAVFEDWRNIPPLIRLRESLRFLIVDGQMKSNCLIPLSWVERRAPVVLDEWVKNLRDRTFRPWEKPPTLSMERIRQGLGSEKWFSELPSDRQAQVTKTIGISIADPYFRAQHISGGHISAAGLRSMLNMELGLIVEAVNDLMVEEMKVRR